MNIKLSREQELRLIQLGLDHLLTERGEETRKPRRVAWNKGKKTKKKWSDSQRAKFQKTMKKIWAEKKEAKHG